MAASSVQFDGIFKTTIPVREQQFKHWFHSRWSQYVIQDSFYWILAHFFSTQNNDIYEHHHYQTQVKLFETQEAERAKLQQLLELQQQEEENGGMNAAAAAATAANLLNGNNGVPAAAATALQGGSGSPNITGAAGDAAAAAAAAQNAIGPNGTAMIGGKMVDVEQLINKQKKQPILLASDLPDFDILAHLTVGAVLPSDNPDHPAFKLKQSIFVRIATHFVKLFLTIPTAQKDFFFTYYYDVLAQSLYYACLMAFPSSRDLMENYFFRTKLLQLTAFWSMGYIPSILHSEHWKSVALDTKHDTLAAVEQALDEQNERSNRMSDKNSVMNLEKKMNALIAARNAARKKAAHAAKEAAVVAGLSSGGSAHNNSSAVMKLDRDISPSPKAGTRGRKGRRHRNGPLSLTTSVAELSLLPPASPANAPLLSPTSAATALMLPPATAASTALVPGSSNSLVAAAEEELLQQEQKQKQKYEKIPLKVIRKRVKLHHSEFIQAFIDSRHFRFQSDHSVYVPITVTAPDAGKYAGLLEDVIHDNDRIRKSTQELADDLRSSKQQFSRMNAKQKKYMAELSRKLDQERERALREASAYSKTLVSEYQDKKYAELKAPSKALALRRLGHMRSQIHEAKQDKELESSILLRTANRAL